MEYDDPNRHNMTRVAVDDDKLSIEEAPPVVDTEFHNVARAKSPISFDFGSLWEYSPVKSVRHFNEEHYEVNIGFFGLLFLSIVLLVSLLPPSFHYIDYDNYGLLRNNFGDVHLTPTFVQGRYFEPLSFSFVEFPATFQPVEMQTAVFLDNGMEFQLRVRFYYRIPQEGVGELYDRFSNSYDSRIEVSHCHVFVFVFVFIPHLTVPCPVLLLLRPTDREMPRM